MRNHSKGVSRRTALKIGSSGILGTLGLSALSSATAQSDDPNYGEPPTVTSSEGPNYGALDGYDDVIEQGDADYVVETDTELMDALEAAEYGDIVYVPGDAEIDTGARSITSRDPPGFHVPEGVTLASDRGIDGSRGGLIYTDTIVDGWPQESWVMAAHSDARITGLRFRGQYWDSGQVPRSGDDAPHDGYVGSGHPLLLWDGDWGADPGTTTNVEVDNCEFYGWGSCVTAYTGADDCRVHHCDFHDTLIAGLGYGVSIGDGHHEIDYNTFNRTRHAVACNGEQSGYDAHHNVAGSYSMSHVFDAHRPGGDRFDIHHNTIRVVDRNNDFRTGEKMLPGVAIRGVPNDEAWIHHNWFYNPKEPRERPRQEPSGWSEEAIIQVFTDDWNNVDWKRNHYGTETEPKRDIGAPYAEKVEW